nr:hypothetical protein [Tanacetum cinerariifolium]
LDEGGGDASAVVVSAVVVRVMMMGLRGDGGSVGGCWSRVAVAVGCGGFEEWRCVVASVIVDRIDRVIRILFGFAGKSPPEKFFGGGGVVAGDGGRLAGGLQEMMRVFVCFY